MPKKRPEASRSSKKTSDVSERISLVSLEYIEREIQGIASGRIATSPHDPASRIAYLAKHAAQIACERRKAESAELAATRRLTDAQVWAWLKLQPAELRARIARDLVSLDSAEKRSVLG